MSELVRQLAVEFLWFGLGLMVIVFVALLHDDDEMCAAVA